MTDGKMIKGTAAIFGSMLLFTAFHSFASAQLDLPYFIRSILAVSGGSALGLLASLAWVTWLERSDHTRHR